MPTPRDSAEELHPQFEPHSHSSCPPEPNDRPAQWSRQTIGDIEHALADVATRSEEERRLSTGDSNAQARGRVWPSGEDIRDIRNGALSKTTTGADVLGNDLSPTAQAHLKDVRPRTFLENPSSALHLAFSDTHGILSPRLIQSYTSCKLRAGSRYRGTQTSDQQRYNVEVVIKTVDMAESFICGYLKIEGLTPEHATLTTYFEGEIIGPKYTFQTRHESWGATVSDDMKHWGHFQAWKPLAKQAKRADFRYKHTENREHIFMRWKEKFLVPDHKVKEISGASFEGFYYICFNQVEGAISGIYYHSKSDQQHNNKIQNLELKWIPDSGRFAAMEFR